MASINLAKEELMTLIIALPDNKPDLRRKLQWEYDAILREEGKQKYLREIERVEKLTKQAEEVKQSDAENNCPFLVSWVGVCNKPVTRLGRCEEHYRRSKCWKSQCNKLTVQDCSATLTLGVCGVAYCEDHRHERTH